ncbi:MAG TPA: hypothetical protein VKB18_06785 [Gemmatimonadota bacterium]|nr:hypothetical protein [Gemmatimonadota bacterium]
MADPTPRRPLTLALALLAAVAVACGPAERQAADASGSDTGMDDGTIHVIARDFSFQAPDSIPSGWVTFRFDNQGEATHFFVLHHVPDSLSLQTYVDVSVPLFDSAMSLVRAGGTQAEAGQYLAQNLPAWFADITEMGGAGLVAPGGSTTLTQKLPPGRYFMECYVKSADGQFHSALGMVRQLTVTGASSEAQPPEADLELALSGSGIEGPESVGAGPHTVAVHFREQPEGLAGYDVHVARLAEGRSGDDLVPWMSWMNVGGLVSPAPAEFLGGVQEMPTGSTSYFTVDLQPGRYAWISELGAAQGLVRTFTVE